jgi:transposase
VYALKVECLGVWEELAQQGRIDLFYGDESRVSLMPSVPYAWQFRDEDVCLPSERGGGLNCFALLSRDNRCQFATTTGSVKAPFLVEQLERLSLSLSRLTVVVLDNASIHHATEVRERVGAWEERGLYLAYLPPYCPHLNIVEILWRKLKYEWLCVEDYADKETLHFAVWKALAAVGTLLNIRFEKFQNSLI